MAKVPGAALLAFLCSGNQYSFPADAGAESRGVPTADPAGALGQGFSATEPPVWPTIEGSMWGAGGILLRDGAARSEARNPALQGLIALVNAGRLGCDLERSRAKEVLRARIETSLRLCELTRE